MDDRNKKQVNEGKQGTNEPEKHPGQSSQQADQKPPAVRERSRRITRPRRVPRKRVQFD